MLGFSRRANVDSTPSTISRWMTCPVCRSDRRRTYVSFSLLEFVRCNECETVYKAFEPVDLRPADFYESSYFHGRKSGRDTRFEHRVRKAMRLITDGLEFTRARTLLDIGCSLGYVLEAGARLGLDCAGLDISEYAVSRCLERSYRTEKGGLHRLPFRSGEFDLVVMKHVLEHTPDPIGALEEVRRVMSPGGALIVLVPNLDYWKGIFLRGSYRYFRPDDLGMQHYVYYTAATIRRLVGKVGFQVRTTNKAFFHTKAAQRGAGQKMLQSLRFACVYGWQSLAGLLHLRREVLLIATRTPSPTLLR